MFHVALKNVLAHKVRLLLTAISIVLGVAFVGGTLMFTNSLNQGFDSLFGTLYKNVSVQVSGTEVPGSSSSMSYAADSHTQLPESMLAEVAKVPGASEVEGGVEGTAQLVNLTTHKMIGNQMTGTQSIGADLSRLGKDSLITLTAGALPSGPDQLLLDEGTAKDYKVGVGDKVGIATSQGTQPATISGTVKFGGGQSMLGATLVVWDLPAAQQVFNQPGQLSTINVKAAGVSESELASRIQAALGPTVEVKTGEQLTKAAQSEISSGLSFFNTFLLVFAGIALFVGAFIITNTFTMLVASRTKELALLRAIGASRKQVTRSVLAEAVAVGLIGSAVGFGVGALLALGLQKLLSLLGVELPATLSITPASVIWCFATGLVVTVIAAYTPARKAATIPPVAAMRDDIGMPVKSLHRRLTWGTAMVIVGIVSLAAGLLANFSADVACVGIGAAMIFIGVTMLNPAIAKPVVTVLGLPWRHRGGVSGRLAGQNAIRNPRRTAATASALMIGIALVTVITVISSSAKATLNNAVSTSLGCDYGIVTQGFGPPIPASAQKTVAATPGVEVATAYRIGSADPTAARGTTVQTYEFTGVDVDTVTETNKTELISGSYSVLGTGKVMVDESFAKQGHPVGSTLEATFPKAGKQTLTIGGVYKNAEGINLFGQLLVSTDTFLKLFPDNGLVGILANKTAAADPVATEDAIKDALAPVAPQAQVMNQAQVKENASGAIDGLLNVVIGLLGLALVIAVLGIVNTLVLSVIERTREIGLLRAVGMSRRQLRNSIRTESFMITVFGALIGVALGVGLAAAIVTAISGLTLNIPVMALVIYLVIGALVGVVAAIWPARRAAKLNVLAAIAHE